MATLADQLTEKQKDALIAQKDVAEAMELSVQRRVEEAASSTPAVWWFTEPQAQWDVAPWWSPQRDTDLRAFVKRPGNDILAGAVSSMVNKFKAMNWQMEGPESTVKRMQSMLADESEFGRGWSTLVGKTVEDFLTQDRGSFWELVGEGDADGPLDGLPVGVEHLDAARCVLTGDPTWPVVFQSAKTGRPHKLHATRVVHMVDMESPNESMNGVGFCACSRVVASSQILLMLSQYKVEKLGDLPPSGLLMLQNVVPQKWEDAKEEYERERRKLGNEIWANVMVLMGIDPTQPSDAKFISFKSMPEHFDEEKSITTYVNVVALAMGIDARELWPVSSGAMGTAAESLIMHQKAKGKGIGNIISTIERAVNWQVLPKRVSFSFDFTDDEEDLQAAEIDELRTKTIMSMRGDSLDPVVTVPELRQMLADNVSYFRDEFLVVDVSQEVTADDVEQEAEAAWGPLVVVDRKGEVVVPQAYKVRGARSPAVEAALGNFREENIGAAELAAFALAELADGG